MDQTDPQPDKPDLDSMKDASTFESNAEAHRHELHVHCYRILGSTLDAEDAVQETLLRAYRRLETFNRDVSFRAWLYKIATNICFDTLKKRKRTLPRFAFPPTTPRSPLPEMVTDSIWIEPFPTESFSSSMYGNNPAQQYEFGESISLAFVTALQLLSPYQRAVLILRDVLDFRAKETAAILDTTTSAVNSALNRARTNLKQGYHRESNWKDFTTQKDNPLLERYLIAWESEDIDQLVAILQEEATLSMPPWPVWVQGRSAIREILNRDVFSQGTQRDRLMLLSTNNQPGFAIYRRPDSEGVFSGIGIQVLTLAAQGDQISSVDIFLMPSLFAAFDLHKEIT